MPSQECVVLLYFLLNQFPNSRIASRKTPKANPVRPGLSVALHWSLRLHHHDTVLLNGYLKSAAGTARLFHILMSEWDRLRSTNTDATKGQHHCLFPRALCCHALHHLPTPSPLYRWQPFPSSDHHKLCFISIAKIPTTHHQHWTNLHAGHRHCVKCWVTVDPIRPPSLHIEPIGLWVKPNFVHF